MAGHGPVKGKALETTWGPPDAVTRAPAPQGSWWTFGALCLLSAVPLIAGGVRLHGLVTGVAPAAGHERFVDAPLPVIWHVVGATLFCLLGAAQLAWPARARRSRWHRRLGWLALPGGLAAAISGLWMTALYAIPAELQGPLLQGVRWVVGTVMVAALVLALRAARQRRFDAHSAWMVRAYAMGQGAGTQVLMILPLILFTQTPVGLTRDLLMSAAWLVNAAVAEWVIRKRGH